MREILIEKCREFCVRPDLVVPPETVDLLKGFNTVEDIVPGFVDGKNSKSVRTAQTALSTIEYRLDKVGNLHFEAKRLLQLIETFEATIRRELYRDNAVNIRTSRHQLDQAVENAVPKLFTLKRRWELVADLCRSVQSRLSDTKDTIKLQSKLDDNLRWAQQNQ